MAKQEVKFKIYVSDFLLPFLFFQRINREKKYIQRNLIIKKHQIKIYKVYFFFFIKEKVREK